MRDVYLTRESTDQRIDPATEDLQIDLLNELQKQESATNDVKFQALVLGAGIVGTPEPHGCKKMQCWTALSDCYLGDANGQPVLLVASIWNPIPINNISQLRFLSATGGTVYLISNN